MMQSIETTAAAPASFRLACEQALATGRLDDVSDDELRAALTAAVRLYAAKMEAGRTDIDPLDTSQVTATDVVVAVSAMIRGAGLNLWDVAMWFRRPVRDGQGL